MKKLLLGSLLSIAAVCAQADSERDTQLGFSLGAPGGINLVYKTHLGNAPVQISGGYLGDSYGLELGYSFYENTDSWFRSAQITIGKAHIEKDKTWSYYDPSRNTFYSVDYVDEDDWTYASISNTFQFGGFFIEPGLSIGTGDFDSPQFLLQAGWLWSL